MAMPVITLLPRRAVILYSPNHHRQVCLLSKFVDVFLFHGLLVSREPSPQAYRPPVETDNIPVTPNKPSPTRRRLPPTPGTSSSPFAMMAMPEPHPFQPPDMPVAKPYPSTLSFESVRRKTEDSPNSHGGRRLPPEPGYTNGSNTWSDGNKTSVSSMDYQSQVSIASNTSYTSSNSLGSNRKNVSGEAHVRPLGAAPPVLPPKPTTYPEDVKDTWNPFQPSYNAYEYAPEAANGYGSSKTASSNPYDTDIPPPPPPPKLASSSNLPYPDSSSQYPNVIQTSSSRFLSYISSNNS